MVGLSTSLIKEMRLQRHLQKTRFSRFSIPMLNLTFHTKTPYLIPTPDPLPLWKKLTFQWVSIEWEIYRGCPLLIHLHLWELVMGCFTSPTLSGTSSELPGKLACLVADFSWYEFRCFFLSRGYKRIDKEHDGISKFVFNIFIIILSTLRNTKLPALTILQTFCSCEHFITFRPITGQQIIVSMQQLFLHSYTKL